jgi:hypothetical protein
VQSQRYDVFMENWKRYQDERFSTYEAAEMLGMGEHKPQVVAWVRRHIKPIEIDTTNPKKKITRLDLVNIFELTLIKILNRYNIRLGFIDDILSRDQIEELLRSENADYILIVGRVLFITNKPTEFLQRMGGGAAALIIDAEKIGKDIFTSIKKVQK